MPISHQIQISNLPQNSQQAYMFTNTPGHLVINCAISRSVSDNSVLFVITGKWNDPVNSDNYYEEHCALTFNDGKIQHVFIPERHYDVITIEFDRISIPEDVVITLGIIQAEGNTSE